MVGVDDFPGFSALDNLVTAGSGDGVGDMLQEAKIEADYLAKLQDSDGGFYFLVYPREREYESNALPQNGDAQVVWPKTTSATAYMEKAMLGRKRQNDVVHQYAQNADRVLPPSAIPLGNLQTGPVYTGTYGTELAALTATKDQASRSASGTIIGVPATPSKDASFKVSLDAPGMDLDGARIVREGSGQQPAYGETYTYKPSGYGRQWIEAEAQWADGRRVYARTNLFAENGLGSASMATDDSTATAGDESDPAVYTFTRTGGTTGTVTVKFTLSGTAAKWTDYRRPEGDMPEEIVIPAGASSAQLTLVATGSPGTVILTLDGDTGYNIGKPNNGTVTLK